MSVIVNNISKIYGAQRAVDNLSFEVNSGEVLGFLGPNGAGKTTTMKILACFLPQSEGEAIVHGFDVSKDPLEVRKLLGYLPEHNPLYLDMYVVEYLKMVASIHKIAKPKQKIEELLETTGLSLESKKKIGSLSKGYRQRVGLAQAIIHDPKVLILDEPTSGLDPNQLIEIRSLIKTLGQDKTVIFSSHIMQEVEALCDRVIILNQGKLVADDPIASLSSRIKGHTMLRVAFEKSFDKSKLERLSGVEKVELENEIYKISSNRDIDLRAPVFDLAVQSQNRIVMMQLEEASVEKVFQTLTKNNKANA